MERTAISLRLAALVLLGALSGDRFDQSVGRSTSSITSSSRLDLGVPGPRAAYLLPRTRGRWLLSTIEHEGLIRWSRSYEELEFVFLSAVVGPAARIPATVRASRARWRVLPGRSSTTLPDKSCRRHSSVRRRLAPLP